MNTSSRLPNTCWRGRTLAHCSPVRRGKRGWSQKQHGAKRAPNQTKPNQDRQAATPAQQHKSGEPAHCDAAYIKRKDMQPRTIILTDEQ